MGYDRYKRGADTYAPGDYYVQCDVCGFKLRRSQARKRWDNLIVCPKDFEERHPQDYIKTKKDIQAVPDPRPEGSDYFLSTNEVTVDSY